MTDSRGKFVFYSVVFVLSIVVGVTVAVGAAPIRMPTISIVWHSERPGSSPSLIEPTGGPELVLLYIGSSTCVWCNAEELPGTLAELKDLVSKQANDAGYSFATMGIAKDSAVSQGLEHLQKVGGFDEVNTGRGWLNTGALRYVFMEHPGRSATPQVLVLRRTILPNTSTGFTVSGERVLIRKIGLNRIIEWADSGAPLPGVISP